MSYESKNVRVDQLNGTLSLDHMTAEELKALAPHESTLDLKQPRNVAKNLSIPKTVVATMAAWVSSGTQSKAA